MIIPKGAIITVADAIQKLLDRVIQEGSLTAWGKLLGFCYWGIRRPDYQKSEVVGNVSLATKVKRQVSDFMEEAGLPMPMGGVQVQKGGSTDKDLQRGVSVKLAEEDIKGAVRLLASSEGVAPQNDATLEALRQKHPPSPDDLDLPAPPNDEYPSHTIASVEDVKKAISFLQ